MVIEVGGGGARGLLDAAQGGAGSRLPPSLPVDRKEAGNLKGGQDIREKGRASKRGRRRVAGNAPKGNR